MSLHRRVSAVLAVVSAATLLATGSAGATGRSPAGPVTVSGPTPYDVCATSDPTQFVTGTETEAMAAVHPRDPRTIVTVWQQDRFLSGSSRGIVAAVSRDAGRTWSRSPIPGMSCPEITGRITNPWIGFGRDGRLHATATTTGAASGVVAATSDDGGVTWSSVSTLVTDVFAERFSDKQTTTADPRDPRRVYAVWNRRTNATGAHEILFARTVDGGATWEPARPIYAPPAPAGTVGSQIVVLRDGSLLNVFFQNDRPLGSAPAATLTDHILAMRSTDGGTTWSAPVTVADLRVNIPVAPDTGRVIVAPGIVPDVAVDPLTGTVYAVWGDATRSASGSAVALSASRDGGRTWSTPVRAGGTPDSAAGGPGQAFLPQVDVAAGGTVAVTYYDMRRDTAEPGTTTDAWIATCRGGCATGHARWAERHLGGPFAIDTAVTSFGGPFVGTYTGLTHRPGAFVATFVMTTGDPADPQNVYHVATPATPWAHPAKEAP